MSSEDNIRSLREGVPVRTPNHPTKSHMVKYDGKLIRFGEQGAEGSPPKEDKDINMMKQAFGQQYFIDACAAVAAKVKW